MSKSNASNAHKRKVKMARKMMKPYELKIGVGTFESTNWKKRKEQLKFNEVKKIKRGIISAKKS